MVSWFRYITEITFNFLGSVIICKPSSFALQTFQNKHHNHETKKKSAEKSFDGVENLNLLYFRKRLYFLYDLSSVVYME